MVIVEYIKDSSVEQKLFVVTHKGEVDNKMLNYFHVGDHVEIKFKLENIVLDKPFMIVRNSTRGLAIYLKVEEVSRFMTLNDLTLS